MDDFQFMNAALNIGLALNKDRRQEDFLRSQGRDGDANAIYSRNKMNAYLMFNKMGMSPAEFDTRLAKLAKKHRTRVNVKLVRIFNEAFLNEVRI